MQELWLFGQLDTVKNNDKLKDTEERAKTLAGIVERVVKGLGVDAGDAGQRDGNGSGNGSEAGNETGGGEQSMS